MPLPLTVSCFSKIQIGFTFLVPAHLGRPGKRAVKRVCLYVILPGIRYRDCVCLLQLMRLLLTFVSGEVWSDMPSLLWRCWLGGRKGIQPVKNWVVGCWHGSLSGARCRLAYVPADATATHFLASVKSRLVLPFLYRLTWVVSEKWPLNGCVCVVSGEV